MQTSTGGFRGTDHSLICGLGVCVGVAGTVGGLIDVQATTDTDEDLLIRIRERDLQALEHLYDRYKSFAYALAYKIVGGRETAEEVVQDAFMSVWKQAQTYESKVGRVRPWLLSIVHNRAIDSLRRVRGKQTASLDEAWMVASDDDIFLDVYGGLQRDQIVRALDALPLEQRQAIEMAYFQGYSFTEMAEITNTPTGTWKSRVRLAVGKLRQILDEEVVS